MKTRHVIGKRIARVKQGRVSHGHGYRPGNAIEYIELEDGTRLYILVHEGDADYTTDIVVNRRNLKKK